MLTRILQVLLLTLAWAGLGFLAAGTLDWPRGWIMLGAYLVTFILNGMIMARFNPDLFVRRGESHPDAENFDKIFGYIFTAIMLAMPVVAGFDAVRFRWSSQPGYTLWLGLFLHILGAAPILGAMAINPFLTTNVRIQAEAGHYVVDRGPYRLIRHPMYLGMILQYLAVPLGLGSSWTFIPVGLSVGLLCWRLEAEDRTLKAKLPGYAEYAGRTRYRLIPGLW